MASDSLSDVLEPGHTLGRYRVEEQLGAGGMGEVYRAWDSLLRRWVALKVVAKDSPHAERLVGEARAAAALRHPNIVSVYDVGEDGGYSFVSMDLVEGRPLRDWIGDASVPFEKQLGWLTQIANALRTAHKGGFVHRDMKPDNVMITTDGDVRVLDFGLAKAFTVDVDGPTEAGETSGPQAFRTAEGRVSGTPAYMAPEQLAGGPPSPAWDQYAWGVLGCELLTGKHPRIAGLVSVSGWVKPESMAHVPASVGQVVARAMAPSPDQRFPSMDALVAALGGPVSASGSITPAPATSAPPPGTSVPSATMNVQIGDTLQVPVHPNAPAPQRSRRGLLWIAAGAAVLATSLGVAWRLRATPPAIASTAPPASATVVPPPTTAASAAVSASPAATIAPPASAAPSVTAAVAPPTPTIAPARPRHVSVRLYAQPSIQYDTRTVERAVAGVRPLVKSCVEQHPVRVFPATIAVDLELWSVGDEVGKVRAARVSEAPKLAACLSDVFEPLSIGPPKSASMPPGAVFVMIEVTQGP